MSVRAETEAPAACCIVVRGQVSGQLAMALGLGVQPIGHSQPPRYRLTGHVCDQTALVGIVGSLNDAGLQLLSVECRSLEAV